MQNWVRDLKKEYAEGKQLLVQYRQRLSQRQKVEGDGIDTEESDKLQHEIQVVEGMISDMTYAMEWMTIGRKPSQRHGADIRDAYSRSIMMDMDLLPSVQETKREETKVTSEQKVQMIQILMKLSSRERQCYLLHMAQGLSFSDIGRELKLTKRTVQDYVDRAKCKVAQAI